MNGSVGQEEWRRYYERADEARTRFGDPFKRLIAREALQRRLLRIGVTVLVLAALITLVWMVIALANSESVELLSAAPITRGKPRISLADTRKPDSFRRSLDGRHLQGDSGRIVVRCQRGGASARSAPRPEAPRAERVRLG